MKCGDASDGGILTSQDHTSQVSGIIQTDVVTYTNEALLRLQNVTFTFSAFDC